MGPDGAPLHLERSMQRNELEMLTQDLVERTIEVSRDVLRDAQVSPSAIQTRIGAEPIQAGPNSRLMVG